MSTLLEKLQSRQEILADDALFGEVHAIKADNEVWIAELNIGYNLPAKYVLHTVGPIVYDQLTYLERDQLRSSYQNCLELAAQKGLTSVAFCCISTGEFRFPQAEAAQIAIETVREFLKTHENMQVVFNVFKDEDLKIYQDLLGN